MKKNHILFAGLVFLIALLLCAAASAAPLSREQVEARLAAGGTITEEERMEILNANLGDDIPTDVGLGRDVTVSTDGGKYRILLSALPFTVEFPNSKQTVELKLKDTWMEVAEDAVLIQEKSSGWFPGGNIAVPRLRLYGIQQHSPEGRCSRVDPGDRRVSSRILRRQRNRQQHPGPRGEDQLLAGHPGLATIWQQKT